VHQCSGLVGRPLYGDAQPKQNHQAAGVKIALAGKMLEMVHQRLQRFLPALRGVSSPMDFLIVGPNRVASSTV
jgi:hypothetical protein